MTAPAPPTLRIRWKTATGEGEIEGDPALVEKHLERLVGLSSELVSARADIGAMRTEIGGLRSESAELRKDVRAFAKQIDSVYRMLLKLP
jgi:uncharacterized coiled-coil DUF342 family protein